MNKTDLVKATTETTGYTKKDVEAVVDAALETIVTALKNGDKVKLAGFGNFEVRERSARKGRNPQTGEEIDIPATKVPAFKPAPAFKEQVKQ
ncbi:HU family DNA-binding protein [Paenibacillus polymyxa]|uniref:DNA-binding protein hu-alpha (Histone) n=1 Tax=Paenibacillus polymyxa TaxID=1406 RepID=A0A378Y1B0_PAEPO|nr:HU family DNA-binding protein [Paenibacillus polymyxa]MBE7896249.1 HU family DNA-binding protein [Paenibacillus polymyxa]MBG9765828.1 DNA-binding protein [Paenibacillus polymyxa]MCC3256777.1 HU family DNA-binding protein [Paenibacillus polymyxa]MDY8021247.1 HU family DNA-binding protein [Paenibacillus polymyxa]QPK54735.1 HU family DNA-binding protein [Paenibacillus polymyxa]